MKFMVTDKKRKRDTHKPLCNTVHYNTVLDITWFKDGSKNIKIILTINDQFLT